MWLDSPHNIRDHAMARKYRKKTNFLHETTIFALIYGVLFIS
jgi:hypothetical protein